MIAEDEVQMLKGLKNLFKETQSLPQAEFISEEQIAEEVMAYLVAR